jgi:TfoX/Sxy family transcriptional regulator of competence genes
MQMPKPTDADRATFHGLVPDDPRVTVKPMFGNLGAFVNGNMFMGLFGSDVGVKLAADDAGELLAVEGSGPFGPAERPMGGYVALPRAYLTGEEGSRWVARALEHVAAMPAREPGRR